MTLTHSTTKTPTPHELRVAAALERLATDAATCAEQATARADGYRRIARKAWGIGDDELASAVGGHADQEAAEAAFFKRGANAYVKALTLWQRGVRPERLPSGAYILPSSRYGEPPHLLTKATDWQCTCPSGGAMHWASALLIGVEVAGDELDATDAGQALPFEPTPAEGRAERRAAIEAAASEWF